MEITKKMPHREEAWTGYTLDELKYRRAYLAARKELEKERLLHNVSQLRGAAGTTTMNVFKKVSSGIPLLNYGLLAFNIGSKAWKMIRRFRPKRKK